MLNNTAMLQDDPQREIERLKIKCNGMADRLELQKRMEEGTGLGFFYSLITILCYLDQNGHVFKLQRQTKNQQYVYVSQKPFFELFSKRMPDCSEKEISKILMSFEIMGNSDKGFKTTYRGKRVLKLDAERFEFLARGLSANDKKSRK